MNAINNATPIAKPTPRPMDLAQKKASEEVAKALANPTPESKAPVDAKVQRQSRAAASAAGQSIAAKVNAQPLKTNQDLINHSYKAGGNTYEGASQYLKDNYNTDMNTLVKNRGADISGLDQAKMNNVANANDATPDSQGPRAKNTTIGATADDGYINAPLSATADDGYVNAPSSATADDGYVNAPSSATADDGYVDAPKPAALEKEKALKTNQDLINRAYTQGGNTFEGAATYLDKSYNVDINQLVKDRAGSIDDLTSQMIQNRANKDATSDDGYKNAIEPATSNEGFQSTRGVRKGILI